MYCAKCIVHGSEMLSDKKKIFNYKGESYIGPVFRCEKCDKEYLFIKGKQSFESVKAKNKNGEILEVVNGNYETLTRENSEKIENENKESIKAQNKKKQKKLLKKTYKQKGDFKKQ